MDFWGRADRGDALSPREVARCGVFGAAALLLPIIFHVFHLGRVFMPMYLPLMALAFFVRPSAAACTALTVPVFSGLVTGMPPFYPPVAPVMALELAAMAFIVGELRRRFVRMPVGVCLGLALIAGRCLAVALTYGAAKVMALPPRFVAGLSLLSGWPGIVLMMVVIPQVVRLAGPGPTGKDGC